MGKREIDPQAAARELERAVRSLHFKGSLVNGHTGGVYLDDRRYDPFWETMQELDVPMYLYSAGLWIVLNRPWRRGAAYLAGSLTDHRTGKLAPH